MIDQMFKTINTTYDALAELKDSKLIEKIFGNHSAFSIAEIL
jgi:hypothetical protein